MAQYDYDLFVIGAGSGGVRAARMAAGFGVRVAVAEDRYLGGTCVNVGCIPKKLFVYASHFREDFEDARGFGWKSELPEFDWNILRDNKNKEILRLNGIYQRLLESAGCKLIDGRAVVTDEHTVTVGEHSYTTERILVATGGWPTIPDIPGRQHAISSNEAFYLDALPEQVVIVGGGYIAVEFAGIFHGLGVETTLLYRGPLFMRGFDDEVRTFLAEQMSQTGITLRFDCNVTAIEKIDGAYTATLNDGSLLQTGLVMYATGRHPNSMELGLENVGVALNEKGAIIVDEQYQTSVASIYALGDVTDRINLTPVALAEGMALARNLYAGTDYRVDYEYVPTAVFSQPNIGTVGLTEAQARERYREVLIFRSSFTPLKHTMTGSADKTLMKMIVDADSDRVVGIHMVGPDAGEMIQGMAIALRAGATKAIFDTTIGIHPTAAEEFVTMREPVAS